MKPDKEIVAGGGHLPAGEGYALVLDDASGKYKSVEQMNEFMGEFKVLCKKHGFRLKHRGPRNIVQKFWVRTLLIKALDGALEEFPFQVKL